MNLLADVSFCTISEKDDFTIKIERISSGWMNFNIGTSDKRFSYSASYLTEALTDLVEVAILLLKYQGNEKVKMHRGKIKIAGQGICIVDHQLEPGDIIWHFQPSNNYLKILIWDNIDWDLLENIDIYGYDNEYHEFYSEILPDIDKQLLFALQLPTKTFAKIIVDTLNDVENMYTDEEYLARWFSSYPTDLVSELRRLECSN